MDLIIKVRADEVRKYYFEIEKLFNDLKLAPREYIELKHGVYIYFEEPYLACTVRFTTVRLYGGYFRNVECANFDRRTESLIDVADLMLIVMNALKEMKGKKERQDKNDKADASA